MTIKKSEIIAARYEKTGQSYKHQLLFVGEVWENNFGCRGIVTFKSNKDGTKKYLYCEMNGTEHGLPEDKAGFNDGTYVGNVCDNSTLMKEFIDNGLIVDDTDIISTPPVIEEVVAETKPEPVAEEKPKSTRKRQTKKAKPVVEVQEETKDEPKAEQTEEKCNYACHKTPISLLAKINNIRVAWSKSNVEKDGLGRAGGGSKYEYYKPQQVIDFCLKEEVKNNIFSEFDTIRNDEGITTSCYYKVIDIDTGETKQVSCPFEVPTKMACSQAQQIGAALTYYNRRLAMLMYKIEDNSRESVSILEDADYTAQNAPEIPAPPIVPPAPQVAETLPTPPVQAEATSKPVEESVAPQVTTVPPVQEQPKSDDVAWENEQKEPIVEEPKVEIPQPPKEIVADVPPTPPTSPVIEQPKTVVGSPKMEQPKTVVGSPKMEQPKTVVGSPKMEQPKVNKSIEDLY